MSHTEGWQNMAKSFSLDEGPLLTLLETDGERGLTDSEARRRFTFIPVTIKIKAGKGIHERISAVFWEPFNQLLLASVVVGCILSFMQADLNIVLGTVVEPLVVLIIVGVNAGIQIAQDIRTDQFMSHDPEELKHEVYVIRDANVSVKMDARKVVQGDVIEVVRGDVVAAEARLLELYTPVLIVQQGTANLVKKPGVQHDADAPEDQQFNMLLAGSTILSGQGRAVIVGEYRHPSTTYFGLCKRPLKDTIQGLKRQIQFSVLGFCLFLWIANIRHFGDGLYGGWIRGALHHFKLLVSLAVAAIPEGLPTAYRICVAVALRNVYEVSDEALIKNHSVMESLDNVDLVVSEVSGVLIEDTLTPSKLVTVDADAEGLEEVTLDSELNEAPSLFPQIIRICALCSINEDSPAIKALADLSLKYAEEAKSWQDRSVQLICLDSDPVRQSMSIYCQDVESGETQLLSVGLAEGLLDRCENVQSGAGPELLLTNELRTLLKDKIKCMSLDEGLQVMACAVRKDPPPFEGLDGPRQYRAAESELTFVGLIGLSFKVKSDAVSWLKSKPTILLTAGSHLVAVNVAKTVGLIDSGDESHSCITGTDFAALSEEVQREQIGSIKVFGLTSPLQKRNILNLLSKTASFVLVDDSGYSEASAQAMIGTKKTVSSAADIFIPSLTSLPQIFTAGQRLCSNLRNYVNYLLATNAGEVLLVTMAVLLGFPEPLQSIHLLYLNLLTDGLPATALAFDDDPRQGLASFGIDWIRIAVIGIYSGMVAFWSACWWLCWNTHGPKVPFLQLINYAQHLELRSVLTPGVLQKAQTLALSVLIFAEILAAFGGNIHRAVKNWPLLLAVALTAFGHFLILSNDVTLDLLNLSWLTLQEWKIVLMLSTPVLALDILCSAINCRVKLCYKKPAGNKMKSD